MDNIELKLTTGIDISVKECNIVLHQPSILEISTIGEENFFIGVQTLCLNKSMFIEDDTTDIRNFDIFIQIMTDALTVDKRNCVKKVLELVMPKYKISFTPKSILINVEGAFFIIDGDNFDIFQSYIKKIFCSTQGPMDRQAFNPADKKAKEIADKIMRGRKRVAEQKSGNSNSIFSQYISILSIALQKTTREICELTMYQLYDLMERYGLYVNWDIDLKLRLAGGTPDRAAENWMKNIH